MLLSQTAAYALRAMACLAIAPPDTRVRASELSRDTGIPAHYLSKVLRRLVLAGVLVSQKGQGGGFRLARPPQQIRFMDILAAVDALPAPGSCAFGWSSCSQTTPCLLHQSWNRLSDAALDWASTTTLAEIADGRRDSDR